MSPVCCECECERRGNIFGEAIGELKLSPHDLRRHHSRLMTWVREQYAVWGPQKTVFVRKDSWCKSADNTGESEGDNEERSVVLCRESGRWINSRRADIIKEILPFFPECTAALLHCAVERKKLLPNFTDTWEEGAMKTLCEITPFYIIWKWNIPLSTALVKQNPEWKCCIPGNLLARRVKNTKTAAPLKIQSNCTISSSGNLQELQCKLNFIVCDDKMLIFSHMETQGYYKDYLMIRVLQCHIAMTIK